MRLSTAPSCLELRSSWNGVTLLLPVPSPWHQAKKGLARDFYQKALKAKVKTDEQYRNGTAAEKLAIDKVRGEFGLFYVWYAAAMPEFDPKDLNGLYEKHIGELTLDRLKNYGVMSDVSTGIGKVNCHGHFFNPTRLLPDIKSTIKYAQENGLSSTVVSMFSCYFRCIWGAPQQTGNTPAERAESLKQLGKSEFKKVMKFKSTREFEDSSLSMKGGFAGTVSHYGLIVLGQRTPAMVQTVLEGYNNYCVKFTRSAVTAQTTRAVIVESLLHITGFCHDDERMEAFAAASDIMKLIITQADILSSFSAAMISYYKARMAKNPASLRAAAAFAVTTDHWFIYVWCMLALAIVSKDTASIDEMFEKVSSLPISSYAYCYSENVKAVHFK